MDLESLGALPLLPMLEIAWADGEVQTAEQVRIGALAQAWDPGDEAMRLVRNWIHYAPSPVYCERGRQALAQVLSHSHPEDGPWDAKILLEEAHNIAKSAGNPFFRICRSERVVIEKLRKALEGAPSPPPEAFERVHPDLDRQINQVTLTFEEDGPDGGDGGVLIPDFAPGLRFSVPPSGLILGSGEIAEVRILDAPGIDAGHCRLFRRHGRYYLRELGGVTRVNGERILERRLLGGETVRVAPGCSFAFKRVRHVSPQLVS